MPCRISSVRASSRRCSWLADLTVRRSIWRCCTIVAFGWSDACSTRNGYLVGLADDLVATTAAADIKMAGILGRIDRFVIGSGTAAAPSEPFNPTWPLAGDAPGDLDLRHERITTVIWATGYRRVYPWLHVPVLDARGEIVHDGGATAEPGLYVLGLNFQRRRNSSFIDGVGDDARVIAEQIAQSVKHVRVA